MAKSDKKRYTFDRDACNKIIDAVKKSEGTVSNQTRPHSPGNYPMPVYIAKLDEDIAPTTGSTFESGNATLQQLTTDGKLESSSTQHTIYNMRNIGANDDDLVQAFREPLSGLLYFDPGKGTLIRFELQDKFATSDDTVEGLRVQYNGGSYDTTGTRINLIDPWKQFEGDTGYYGWAVKMDDRGEDSGYPGYEIIAMEGPARFVRFTLSEDMEDGDADASCSTGWGAPFKGVEPESTISVVDNLDAYPYKPSGEQGIGIWDEATSEYKIVKMRDGIFCGTAYQQWSKGSPPYVMVNPSTSPGTAGDDTVTHKVFLPESIDLLDPNINAGDEVHYRQLDLTTNYAIVSDYLDGIIGVSLEWQIGATSDIRKGWEEHEESQGLFFRARAESGDYNTVGDTGGYDASSDALNAHTQHKHDLYLTETDAVEYGGGLSLVSSTNTSIGYDYDGSSDSEDFLDHYGDNRPEFIVRRAIIRIDNSVSGMGEALPGAVAANDIAGMATTDSSSGCAVNIPHRTA